MLLFHPHPPLVWFPLGNSVKSKVETRPFCLIIMAPAEKEAAETTTTASKEWEFFSSSFSLCVFPAISSSVYEDVSANFLNRRLALSRANASNAGQIGKDSIFEEPFLSPGNAQITGLNR